MSGWKCSGAGVGRVVIWMWIGLRGLQVFRTPKIWHMHLSRTTTVHRGSSQRCCVFPALCIFGRRLYLKVSSAKAGITISEDHSEAQRHGVAVRLQTDEYHPTVGPRRVSDVEHCWVQNTATCPLAARRLQPVCGFIISCAVVERNSAARLVLGGVYRSTQGYDTCCTIYEVI